MMRRKIDGATGGPRRRAALAVRLLAALCLLWGCAGGGSSGFDVVAAENDTIDRVLDTSNCETERGLTICASSTAAPTAGGPTITATPVPMSTGTPTGSPAAATQTTTPARGTPTATPSRTATAPPAAPGVDIGLDPADVANCEVASDAQSCTLTVFFMPTSVPAGAAYRGAVRQRQPDSPWQIVPVTGHQFTIEIPPNVALLQTAVLVYERDPGPVPTEVPVLSDSGADFAFVTPPVTVRDGGAP
jgi:hypothetical protein